MSSLPSKPIIGITPSPIREERPHGTFDRYAMSVNYVEAVLAAGGVPLVLPFQQGNTAALLDLVDGLLLSGGGDVAPERYGDNEVHPKTYGVHLLRDQFEFKLISDANERNMPMLCICRGLQVLNVAYGGTLYQDVPSSPVTSHEHRQEELSLAPDAVSHQVHFEKGSPLTSFYENERIGANSFHHQAIKDVGHGLHVYGRADDELVESVGDPSRPFVVGVQWHPEMMYKRHAGQLALFSALIEAASVAQHVAI